jgi:glycosyltransferase involved in cell wall biosynthesis
MPEKLDLTVIICTHNRAESLSETLRCLAEADATGLAFEVVVVANHCTDATPAVVTSFQETLRLRYLSETKLGKSHCLNHALENGGLGEIVAVLDDDMSPEAEWLQGVVSLCRRWPEMDVFSGNSYVIWPPGNLPSWARRPSLLGWAYSVIHYGDKDKPLPASRWPSGNHFWFRSRVLRNERRFADSWVAEARFVMDLVADGHGMVVGPGSNCGHRIQPALLLERTIRERAAKTGRSFANVRMKPFRATSKQAAHFKKHPIIARMFCVLCLLRWGASYLFAAVRWSHDDRFEAKLCAIERIAFYREVLRVAGEVECYRMGSALPHWLKRLAAIMLFPRTV